MNIYNSWELPSAIYSDLIVSKELIYDPCQFKCSEPIFEKESSKYGACFFKLNSNNVKFRVAKITPTKIGQFVTLWKRIADGTIQPFDINESFDFIIITTRKNANFGQFIFPKNILYKYGILSNNGKGGKRAIRVYPPWDITTSIQAKKTQEWQLNYFLEIIKNKPIDYAQAKKLFNLNN